VNAAIALSLIGCIVAVDAMCLWAAMRDRHTRLDEFRVRTPTSLDRMLADAYAAMCDPIMVETARERVHASRHHDA
jgi:hypothetical protein